MGNITLMKTHIALPWTWLISKQKKCGVILYLIIRECDSYSVSLGSCRKYYPVDRIFHLVQYVMLYKCVRHHSLGWLQTQLCETFPGLRTATKLYIMCVWGPWGTAAALKTQLNFWDLIPIQEMKVTQWHLEEERKKSATAKDRRTLITESFGTSRPSWTDRERLWLVATFITVSGRGKVIRVLLGFSLCGCSNSGSPLHSKNCRMPFLSFFTMKQYHIGFCKLFFLCCNFTFCIHYYLATQVSQAAAELMGRHLLLMPR